MRLDHLIAVVSFILAKLRNPDALWLIKIATVRTKDDDGDDGWERGSEKRSRPVTQRRGGRTRSENETAIDIHRHLGPGLLESVYEVVLAYELSKHGLAIERQVPIAIVYKGIEFEDAFRADLIIDGKVIIELKSGADYQSTS